MGFAKSLEVKELIDVCFYGWCEGFCVLWMGDCA